KIRQHSRWMGFSERGRACGHEAADAAHYLNARRLAALLAPNGLAQTVQGWVELEQGRQGLLDAAREREGRGGFAVPGAPVGSELVIWQGDRAAARLGATRAARRQRDVQGGIVGRELAPGRDITRRDFEEPVYVASGRGAGVVHVATQVPAEDAVATGLDVGVPLDFGLQERG